LFRSDWSKNATEDREILYQAKYDLPTLPRFEETYYVPADEMERHGRRIAALKIMLPLPRYGYTRIGVAWWAYRATAGYPAVALDPEYTERV